MRLPEFPSGSGAHTMLDSWSAKVPHLARRMFEHDAVRLALLVATAAFLVDWASKSWVLERVGDGSMPLGALTLAVARNDAFAFSIGADRVHLALVLTVRFAALGAIVLLCRHIVYLLNYRNACGFAFLLAGGFGNAADLLFRGGAVVDFIGAGPIVLERAGVPTHVHLFFNTADLFVLIGLGLLGPLIHKAGRVAQRRLAAWEKRVLARGTPL